MGRHTRDIDILEQNLTLSRRGKADDGPNERGLSRSIATENGNDLSLSNFKGDPLKDIAIPVIGVDVQDS
jgi:hypothetical protein